MPERVVSAGSPVMDVTPARATATRYRWKSWHSVVSLCCAAVFISYIDRTNISVASIPMKEQFGWTETTKGLVLSSFFVGYLLLQVMSGTLANKYGGKIVLGVAVLWWSLFTMLTPPAAALSLPALIGARIALGLGEAAVFPASINMVGRWVPVSSRSRAVAFFMSGLSIGTVVSLPVQRSACCSCAVRPERGRCAPRASTRTPSTLRRVMRRSSGESATRSPRCLGSSAWP